MCQFPRRHQGMFISKSLSTVLIKNLINIPKFEPKCPLKSAEIIKAALHGPLRKLYRVKS